MCGRFTLAAPPQQLADLFDLDVTPDWEARYNVAPTQNVLSVRIDQHHVRQAIPVRWGLIPWWSTDEKQAARMINARCETLDKKRAFREAYQRRRCLIAADGFYEWDRTGKPRQPYAIRMRDERAFAFAGLWERWKDDEGPAIETATIVTTRANAILEPIHDRMPVIVPAEFYNEWLDPTQPTVSESKKVFEPWPAEQMQIYAVSTRTSNVANDDPECLTRVPTLFDP